MKFGVIIFPGSNCDHDAYWTIQQVAVDTNHWATQITALHIEH